MEALTGLAVKQLLTLGGGYLLFAVILILFLYERKDKNEQKKEFTAQIEKLNDSKDRLYERLFTTSDKQTEMITRVNAVLEHNDRTLNSVNGTLSTLAMDNRRRR